MSQLLIKLREDFAQLRAKAQVSKVDLERLTKTGGGSVGNFESGVTQITVSKLAKWCDHLGLEIVIRKKKVTKNSTI